MKAKATGRRSRFRRDPRPPRLDLQPRDVRILGLAYRYRLLDRELIQSLAGFGCAVRANVRLRRLFDHGYLGRRFLPCLMGSARPLYHVGPAGVPIVAQSMGLDPGTVRRQVQGVRRPGDFFLAHTLAVSRVRAAFSLGIASHPALDLGVWMDGAEFANSNGKARPLIPDAYFQYRYQGKRFACFLEVDRGTESLRRIQAKVRRYLEYGLAGEHLREFGLRFFRTLFVAPGEKRLRNLRGAVTSVTDKMAWFALEDDLRPTAVFTAIWLRPTGGERCSLLEG